MKSPVYYLPFNWQYTNVIDQVKRLLKAAGAEKVIENGDLVAIKVHMGERGNFRHPRPQIVRAVVDFVRELGGKPFVTDTTTLYSGYRRDAVEYLETAMINGFSPATVNAPIVIADGLKGHDYRVVRTGGELGEVEVASAIAEADAMIVVSHVKFHISFGFGGALKNLAMGCVARKAKFKMHAVTKPTVVPEKCTGCGFCAKHCPYGAISIVNGKAKIDYNICKGCGDCMAHCRFNAITITWDRTERILRLAAEAAYAVMKTFKEGKVFFLNLVMEVTRFCDCGTLLETQIVPDLGILASFDPVAIDKASIDLINSVPGLRYENGTFIPIEPGMDKIRIFWERNWWVLLEEAEKWGLGKRDYELIRI